MKRNILFIVVLMMALCGCCKESFVLLPDLNGKVGKISVKPEQGDAVEVNTAYTAVSVASNKEAGAPESISKEAVERQFGHALDVAPTAPARFLLHFLHDSNEMQPESAPLIESIVQAWKDRQSTDISIVGHTDATGDEMYNYRLSLGRAQEVGALLVEAGIPKKILQIVSHGEKNPLFRVPDDVREPRNRRVEVIVR